MILNRLLIAALSATVIFSGVAEATKPNTVAVIDVNAVLQNSKFADTMKKEHEAFTKQAEALNTKFTALRTEYEAFKKKSSVMSKDEQTKAEKTLAEKQNKLRAEEMALQKSFITKRDALTTKAMTVIKTSVTKIAKKNHYSLVVNKGDSLYSSTDITAQVQKDIK